MSELRPDMRREFMSLLRYEPETGLFYWIENRAPGIKAGTVAGTLRSDGYVRLAINRKKYAAHRIAWLYMNGALPINDIDHVDGVRHNNRIANLRDVTMSENKQNLKSARSDSKSGHLGVHLDSVSGKYVAQLTVHGKQVLYKAFNLIDDAIDCRKAAELIYFPTKPNNRQPLGIKT